MRFKFDVGQSVSVLCMSPLVAIPKTQVIDRREYDPYWYELKEDGTLLHERPEPYYAVEDDPQMWFSEKCLRSIDDDEYDGVNDDYKIEEEKETSLWREGVHMSGIQVSPQVFGWSL